MNHEQHILGCLLGTAVGDAIGLPREGLSVRRAGRLFGGPPLGHAFLAGRGMCSDDTEHTVMVGQALLASGGDPVLFANDFARRLRWWLVRVPAGIGFGTLRACLKLWLGADPASSGVKSAGNGPAMRSALLGLYADTQGDLQALVAASTAVTHSDPRAHQGAAVIANATRWITQPEDQRGELEVVLVDGVVDPQLKRFIKAAILAAEQGRPPEALADEIGASKGVTGYVNHTVPAAVYCWLAHRGSFRDVVETAVCMGGDSDTTAAIAGALAGCELGADAVPEPWLSGLREWPCDVDWMKRLAGLLAHQHAGQPQTPPRFSALKSVIRNVLFTLVVLVHGLRRLLPPY